MLRSSDDEAQRKADILSMRCGGCPNCGSFEATYQCIRIPDKEPIEYFRCNKCGTRYEPLA